MITIIMAACLLYCSAPTTCSASGGHTKSLLSKQDINSPQNFSECLYNSGSCCSRNWRPYALGRSQVKEEVRRFYKKIIDEVKERNQLQEQHLEEQHQQQKQLEMRYLQELKSIDAAAPAVYDFFYNYYGERLIEEWPCPLDQQNDPECPRIQLRYKILENITTKGIEKTTRYYPFDKKSCKTLELAAINYCQELHGTAYQHLLQQEFHQLYSRVCEWSTSPADKDNLVFCDFLQQMLEIGMCFNYHHLTDKATVIADWVWLIDDIGVWETPSQDVENVQLNQKTNQIEWWWHTVGVRTACAIYYAGEVHYSRCPLSMQNTDQLVARAEETFDAATALLKLIPQDSVFRIAKKFSLEQILSRKINKIGLEWFAAVKGRLSREIQNSQSATNPVELMAKDSVGSLIAMIAAETLATYDFSADDDDAE